MVGVAGQRQNKGRLCFDLLAQTQHATFILPFRIESRSAYLLGCKRPRNGSLSLPTLAVRVQVPQRKKRKDTPLRRVFFPFMVGVAGLEPAASWSRSASRTYFIAFLTLFSPFRYIQYGVWTFYIHCFHIIQS